MEVITKDELEETLIENRNKKIEEERKRQMEEVYPKYKEDIDEIFDTIDTVMSDTTRKGVNVNKKFSYEYELEPRLPYLDDWFREYRKTKPEMSGVRFSDAQKQEYYNKELAKEISERDEVRRHNQESKERTIASALVIANFFRAFGYTTMLKFDEDYYGKVNGIIVIVSFKSERIPLIENEIKSVDRMTTMW